MIPKHHVIISAALGGITSYATQSVSSGVACFLAGTAIDVDHFYDYFRHYGFRFSTEAFYSDRYFVESGKSFVWLHSYELLPLIWVLFYCLQLQQLGVGVCVGFLSHLLCDQYSNGLHPMAYFLSFRMSRNFRLLRTKHVSG